LKNLSMVVWCMRWFATKPAFLETAGLNIFPAVSFWVIHRGGIWLFYGWYII